MSKLTGTESLSHNASTLEDLFFAKRDALLMKNKKEQITLETRRQSLKEHTSFSEKTIDELAALGIDYTALKVVSLIPLIQVAWADNYMDSKEIEAILRAAHAEGIEEDSVEFSLVEHWINENPDPSLFQAWKDFTADSIKNMANEDIEILKSHILNISQKVAESAGGFLGFGSVSDVEQVVIKQIKAAFQR